MENLNPLIITLLWFAVGVIFVGYILPHLGGWKRLEKKYGTDKKAKEMRAKRLRIYLCKIGGLSYKSVVQFYETQEGLLLTQLWLFGWSQQNLLIPWKDIRDCQLRTELFGVKWFKLVIGYPTISDIEIPQRQFQDMKRLLTHLDARD